MAWLSGWTYRKKITVDSTKVGAGTHTDFPVAFPLDADITAEMQALGQDIRVTASDGSTLLPHYLSQIGGVATRDGCWSWFSAPNAIYDATNNCVYYGGMNAHSTVSDEVSVWKHDFDTGQFSLNYLNPTHEEYGDDHNNPAFCLRSDGKLIVFTPSHAKTTSTQAYFISSSAGDISAFGAQKTISGWPGSTKPAYSQAWRLSSESSGQKIWWFGRVSAAGGDSWYYTTSTDDGDAFATAAPFWVGTGQCYCISISNGTNRIDFFLTDAHPDQGNQKIYHIYYDGNWRNSDASLINGGAIPSGGFDSSDLNSSSTVMDLSAGSSTCWISSTNYNASGSVVASLIVWPDDDTSAPEHHWASYSSGWTTEKIADASRLTSGATQPYYTGCSAVDPDEDAGVYLGVDVSGVIEIQRFVKSGTWAKADDITTGSAADNFRPYVTYNHAGGQNHGKVFWCQGGFYNNYIPALTSFKTGLRAFPPLVGFRATFKADSLSDSANAEFYVYYGNALATGAESPASVYSGALAVPDLGPGDLTDNEVFADRFLGTDYVPQRYMEHGSRISSEVPVLQADSKLSPINTTRWLTGPSLDMSGATGVTVEFFINYDSSGSNEHTVISNLKADGSQGGMLIRIEPASPADALEVFFDASSARVSGTSAAGSIPANTDKFVSVVYNGNESGSSKIYAQFDQGTRSQLYTGGSSSIKSPGSNVAMEMFRWADISGDTLLGAIGEMRVWGSAKSQGWSDTTYANFKTAGFYTLGVEETDTGATITASGAVQGQALGNVTLTQGYELAVSGLSQGQGAGAATLTQAHELTPNSVEQGHTVGQPAITQGHQIAPASVEQLQAIGVTELTQAHLIVPASLGQAQAIAMTTLIQAHVLGPEAVSHVQSLSSPSLTAAGDLVINALSQATGLGAVELVQANILTVDALEQGHALASVNVSQAGELLAAGLAQTQGLAASTLIQAHQVAVSNLAQAQTVEQVSLALADLLDIDDLFQGQTADQATLTQAHILSVSNLTQAQLLQAVNFGGLVVGSLKGEIRIYALIDGALTIEPALKGNITIH